MYHHRAIDVHCWTASACIRKQLILSKIYKSLTANRKLSKANPPLTSVTGDHHGVQCVKLKYRVMSLLVKINVFMPINLTMSAFCQPHKLHVLESNPEPFKVE
ncbi:hypothetical protein SFRURICE_019871 [Spodoptera frugiperda]|nr:hypothetical protein SFRURICE_019871 [Spodoptera frugiperda]